MIVTDTKSFIEKAKIKHGSKYDYSHVVYINSVTKVKIICPKHGEFEQVAYDHLRGVGCKYCAGIVNIGIDNFIIRSKEKHGNKYDYSESTYKNTKTKIKIICPEHGEFTQSPEKHMKGHGCQKCGNIKISNHFSKSESEFINKSNIVHNNKYEYKNYKNLSYDVDVKCNIHGWFKQLAERHIIGMGCIKCGIISMVNKNSVDESEFINRSNIIHNNKYEYKNYKKYDEHVMIKCNIHGWFRQTPKVHLQNHGCPTCANELSISSYEQEILETYKSFNPISSDRTIISPFELDIVIESHKLAIEFNGSYWHSDINKPKNYHRNKSDLCEKKGYRLIHIYEYDWVISHKREIIKGIINTHLGLNNRIYARKCKLRELSVDDEREFVNNNHLQGYSSSTKAFGLYYDDELVQMISLKLTNGGKNSWEIQRMCNKIGISVIGGASKLFKQCIIYLEEQNYKELITYSDKGTFTGKIYEELGFIKLQDTEPNYVWQCGNDILSRQQCQKKKLIKQGYDENMTEVEIMKSLGYRRIFNSGNRKYILKQ